jgi:CopG family transcriptional regulator, nickel-responsive regulator
LSESVKRISISLSPDIVEEFDEIVKLVGYNRSSAVESAMMAFMVENKWSAVIDGIVAGAVTMIYNHHTRGLMDAKRSVQHNYMDVISATTHVHIDQEHCLEIVVVKGTGERIKELSQKLSAIRGVRQLKFSILNVT